MIFIYLLDRLFTTTWDGIIKGDVTCLHGPRKNGKTNLAGNYVKKNSIQHWIFPLACIQVDNWKLVLLNSILTGMLSGFLWVKFLRLLEYFECMLPNIVVSCI